MGLGGVGPDKTSACMIEMDLLTTASTAETLETLAAAIDELAVADSIEDVQRLVSSAARLLSGADGATLVLRDGFEWCYVEDDAVQPLWKGRRFAVTDCVTGWSMLDEQPIVIEDVYGDRRLPHDLYRRTFVKSLFVVPIRASAPLGAIGMYWAEPHRASAAQVAVARASRPARRRRWSECVSDERSSAAAQPSRICASSASATR